MLGVKSGDTLPPESHLKIGTMTNISSKRQFKTSKNKGKKKICQTFQLAPEVNEGESVNLSPSANENNSRHPINTTNHHPDESPEIGDVTNHHKNIVQSPALGTQESTTLPNENFSTETQRTVAEDEIILINQWICCFFTTSKSKSLINEDYIAPKDGFPTKLQCGLCYKSGRDMRIKEWLEELYQAGKEVFGNIYIGYLANSIVSMGFDMFSPKSEEPLLYETILSLPLFQNHIFIPVGLPKRIHAPYLLVHILVQPSQNQKKQVANILFEAIVFIWMIRALRLHSIFLIKIPVILFLLKLVLCDIWADI
ncbi:hypothetical protein O181_074901 [Austropuccinia psidii MF-1]|uniref:Uncharacterized protein n=1 Tax=Austropuccinia psidii MF-1 TaxID=1389203 RepID=A0A9Q3F7G5_9BASI|nr:hypothetical protein [Austropuccinia psidii MF-1]